MTRAAVLLLALAAFARADVAQFDAGLDPKEGAVYSADGYHYTSFESSGGQDRWLVDGRPRVQLPEGSLPSATPALSADGSMLLHYLQVFDKQGNPLGLAAAVNGRAVGPLYQEIQSLKLSPRGGNIAYVARTPAGWVVVSRQGAGPAFAEAPVILGVAENGIVYLAPGAGGTWLYRNHKALGRADYESAAVSEDLRRIAGVVPTTGGVFVDIDGKRTGPWASASAPAFSPNGRHAAFLAEKLPASGGSYNALIIDGHPAPMKVCGGCTLTIDDAGRAFEDKLLVALDPRGEMHQLFLDGKELGRPPRVGFASGGSHYVYPMMTGRGVGVGLDGRFIEQGAPLPILASSIPIAFDGTDEYHYWSLVGDRLRLVCGAVDGNGGNTRCAQLGKTLYKPVPAGE